MLISLIRKGNSCRIRIPETMLEQVGIKDMVELVAEEGRLIIQPERTARRRWEEAVASLVGRVEDLTASGEIPGLPRRDA